MRTARGIGLAVLAILGIALPIALALGDGLDRLEAGLSALGPFGPVAFVGVVVTWTLTTVPAIPLMALGGLLFGPWLGTLWSLVGTTLGALGTFAIGRGLGRPVLDRLVARHAVLERVVALVERRPALAIAVTRLVPVFPLTVLNYLFGATRVSLPLYLLVSLLATLPGAALYAGLADVLRRAIRDGDIDTATLLGVGALAVLSIALGLAFRRQLRRGR